MKYLLFTSAVFATICMSRCKQCQVQCPDNADLACGLHIKERMYKMFTSKCTLEAHNECHKTNFSETPLEFCIKNNFVSRKNYEESCPTFCPNHYRPVCGAAKYKDYSYRTFNNGCYLDMINCRGSDEYSGFVEVPLEYCPNHLMKNIFKEQVILSNHKDYREYD